MIVIPQNIRIENLPCVVGLPIGAYCEYFGLLPDGRHFVIVRPEKDWEYDQFVLIVDGQAEMLTNVSRCRDGGTTHLTSSIGKFLFPTPFEPEKKPTLNGEEITVYSRTYVTRPSINPNRKGG